MESLVSHELTDVTIHDGRADLALRVQSHLSQISARTLRRHGGIIVG
jgi:hypothetical protein